MRKNLILPFFLQKKGVKSLFSLSFVGQQKKVKRKKNASAHASQSLQCTCSDFGSGELTSTLQALYCWSSFILFLHYLIYSYKVLVQTTPLLHLIFAGIATLCSAIGQNIDADIPLLVYKALLYSLTFFFILSPPPNSPLVFTTLARCEKLPCKRQCSTKLTGGQRWSKLVFLPLNSNRFYQWVPIDLTT